MQYPEKLLHGVDYYPDQWIGHPEVLAEDLRLMKEAKISAVTLGVFAWSSLEPHDGVYCFDWLDEIMDAMAQNGIRVILATPSAARPPWMAKAHPEIMRMGADRVRLLYGDRENTCNSSRYYREKVRQIDEKLAERYAHHPALMLWHLSNEMYGVCHCPACQQNFRRWLKARYKTLDTLNEAYGSDFWSHRYTDWDELESPAPHGDQALSALGLDYQRFYSELSIDFLKQEAAIVKAQNPAIPVTTNLFHHNCGIDLFKVAQILDVLSWDSYPRWHCGPDPHSEWQAAAGAAFDFDFCRAQKQQPFYLMESTPSVPSQFAACKLKRPGMHLLSAVEAIACGADSVQYFQWRKSRAGREKFHGAVLDHNGSGATRVFADVKAVGEQLESWGHLQGAETKSEVALVCGWENLRALEGQVSLKQGKDYLPLLQEYYAALLKNYVSVDIIDQTADFSRYKMVVAPLLYQFLPGTPEKLRHYIEQGGQLVLSYYSGLVDENDSAFSAFPPYALNDVVGLRSIETDSLCEGETNAVCYRGQTYRAHDLCDLVELQGAEVLSTYEEDFYAGHPALTRHQYGRGTAYYLACRTDGDLLAAFLGDALAGAGIEKILEAPRQPDILVRERRKDGHRYRFVMNFSDKPQTVTAEGQTLSLAGYGYCLLET